MLAKEMRAYRQRWEKVEEFVQSERRRSTPETRLRQTLALLRMSNLLNWRNDSAEIDAVRDRWRRLRALLS
jgi:hypothetical protein